MPDKIVKTSNIPTGWKPGDSGLIVDDDEVVAPELRTPQPRIKPRNAPSR